MAVEKMYLVNIASHLENLDDFLEDVIKIGDIEVVDAFNQLASRSFQIRATRENVELTEDVSTISSFDKDNKKASENLRVISDLFNVADENVRDKYISKENVQKIYSILEPLIEKKEELIKEREKLMAYKENLESLASFGIDIKKLNNLNYFDYRFGDVSKDGRFILKNNYENLPSLILHLDKSLDDLSLGYLNQIIALDEETTDLRDATDKIIEDEKENTLRLLNDYNKEYQIEAKKKSEEIYISILNEAEQKGEEIYKIYNEKKNDLDNKYKEFRDIIVDEIFDSIVKGGDI
ncbi:hypothetical protein [Anaerococcus sp. AGMB09787]|uniref:hypothetical protein n=1 Tax=Anaerococcus sp. AGMB09787 TaxID=2922869 RepID=UPI001FAF6128|nr:hypothetical protein [Anaerococcus sp. AGMB09787]